MTARGTLLGVGTGPGDPELLTLKAVRAIQEAEVIAYFAKQGNESNARRTVSAHVPEQTEELALLYPVTTEAPRQSAEYRSKIAEFYKQAAQKVARHLDEGKTVAVLSEGDPLFYGSYMHLHLRLAHRYPASVLPGITAMSGCWSEAGTPIAQGDDVLSVLPGTMPEDRMVKRLADTEAAIIMKVGRNLPKIRRALKDAGRLDCAIYVERGTMTNGLSMPLEEKADDSAPYFSLILVPGWEAAR